MSANTSAELSPNDSPFSPQLHHSKLLIPASQLNFGTSSSSSSRSNECSTCRSNPDFPLATPKPNPIPTATIQLLDTGLNLSSKFNELLNVKFKMPLQAMDAMLPTIAPHFTVSSPSSVASANGTTNETVVIPRPDLTDNTVTSAPSTVALSTSHLATNIMSQPQSSTFTLSDAPASKLVTIRKRLQDLDQKLAPKVLN